MSQVVKFTERPDRPTDDEPTDQDRIDAAFKELRRRGYTALQGLECPDCGWGTVDRLGDVERAVFYNIHAVEDAFGQLEMPPDWRGTVRRRRSSRQERRGDGHR